MESQAIHIMTIANSIIGVSLLAMPYCFKQCGIFLSLVILILSNIISRLSCHLMLKSAVMARRRTFEFLAFHIFGSLGKFVIEIGLIGFLLGTSIAYFVVMGDLGPAIVAKMTGTKATDTMRTSILMALALFCVLPLGLLRKIDSLTSVCIVTIGFYFCLVLKIIAEAVPHMFSGDWITAVEFWRPAGILQCLPIFSMALSCQTQIFEIYQALPTASLEKMNNLIRVAVNICTGVYIFVGIFGYIAFSNQTFTGNILMSFSTSFISDIMKIGFVLSVAFSFPLIIFPCRASLYSLLYRRTYSIHETVDKYIPECRFKGLTFVIVLVSLIIGIMIPNIELVLGLVGSTIGIMICVVFPATCFICISTKNTNERILAQIMLFIGMLVMVLGTYANLYAMEEIATTSVTEKIIVDVPEILKIVEKDPALKTLDNLDTNKKPVQLIEVSNNEIVKEIRHEPPQPIEPPEPNKNKLKKENENDNKPKDSVKIEDKVPIPENSIDNEIKIKEDIKTKDVAKISIETTKPKKQTQIFTKKDEVDIEAIKKEDKELLDEEKEKLKEVSKNNMDLIKKIEKQNEDNQKLFEDSKRILEEIKQRQLILEESKRKEEIKKVKEEKLKAVEEIEKIAKDAIKKLSATDEKPIVRNDSKPNTGLNKNNLVPMPLASSNNYSHSPIVDKNQNNSFLHNMIAQKIPKKTKNITNNVVDSKDNNPVDLVNLLKTNKANVVSIKQENIEHREIRSVDNDVLVPTSLSFVKSTKENCDKTNVDSNSLYSTEKSIKIVSQLSDPELVSVKLSELELNDLNSVAKPIQRDLKSYKYRKRK